MYDVKGKIVIITGASRGIGKSSALLLAKHGAKIVTCSRNKYGDLSRVAEEINDSGGEGIPISAHIGNKADIERLVNTTLDRYGRIDALINNAATNPVITPLVDLEEEAWDKIMDVNLKGCFLLTQRVARVMMSQRNGSIINVSSDAGVTPSPNLLAYSISKAGLIMMGYGLALELGRYNIRVNNIAPGLIRTRMSEALQQDEVYRTRRLAHTCLGRMGEPDEVARLVLFLVSDASSYITGSIIPIEGGTLVCTLV